jgi:pilus assembly protein Flp/PilA
MTHRLPHTSGRELRHKIIRFLTSEEGPTAIEYAFMAAVVAAACVLAVDAIGSRLNSSFNNSANSIINATSS